MDESRCVPIEEITKTGLNLKRKQNWKKRQHFWIEWETGYENETKTIKLKLKSINLHMIDSVRRMFLHW